MVLNCHELGIREGLNDREGREPVNQKKSVIGLQKVLSFESVSLFRDLFQVKLNLRMWLNYFIYLFQVSSIFVACKVTMRKDIQCAQFLIPYITSKTC